MNGRAEHHPEGQYFLRYTQNGKRQKAADAIPLLRKAATLRPDAIDPHRLLADAYTQLGREESAGRERSEAERIQANGGSRLGTPPEDYPEDK